MRLHADPLRDGLFVAYNDDGWMIARGYLNLEESTGEVSFVNELTREQLGLSALVDTAGP